MGEQDRAVHEISDARARMSELATELSRRIDKEHVKEFATEKATELKERAKELATEKAGELKQHAKDVAAEKAIEVKDRAREAVMTKTTELKERADTSKGWSLLGAILGAGVGATLMRKAFTAREERYEGDRTLYGGGGYGENWRYGAYDRPYDVRTATGGIGSGDLSTSARVSSDSTQGLSMSGDVGFEGRGDMQGSNVGQAVKDKVSDVKERAVEMKDRVKDQAHELKERTMGRVRERVPDREVLKGRASDWFDRTLEEQPLLLALGGIAVGMLASSMLPVTGRERRLMQPAKERVGERIHDLGDRLTDKLRGEEHGGSDIQASGSNLGMSGSTNLGASSSNIGPGNTGISTGAVSSGVDVDRSQDLASPAGSRIPPLPPLDDMTKLH